MSQTFYQIQPGDQLFEILIEHYGRQSFLDDRQSLVEAIQGCNPQITNIDRIFAGDVLMLPTRANSIKEIADTPQVIKQSSHFVATALKHSPAQTTGLLSGLDSEKLFMGTGQGVLDFTKDATKRAALKVKQVPDLYAKLHNAEISRGQYNYQRRIALDQSDQLLGPLRKLKTPGKRAREVVRIDLSSPNRTNKVLKEISDLNRISTVSKYGGVVLKTADVGLSGYKIHTAKSNEKRTTILLDTVGGAVGAAGATALAIFLVGTPVGWGAIAIVALAGAAGGLAGDVASKAIQNNVLFDEQGNRLSTPLDQMWVPVYGPK